MRRLIYSVFILLILFQSTHLREVRHPLNAPGCRPYRFQSTHLREVRPAVSSCVVGSLSFQSTHLREVRPRDCKRRRRADSFNPRTYERCDLPRRALFLAYLVSIHAPTRGATDNSGEMARLAFQFQSTHLREVRRFMSATATVVSLWFQSTHLREVRHGRERRGTGSLKFQSTHLREVRLCSKT